MVMLWLMLGYVQIIAEVKKMANLTWDDLSDDEKRFLIAFHNAPEDARWDALAMLINGRRRDGGDETSGEGGVVVNFEDLKHQDGVR